MRRLSLLFLLLLLTYALWQVAFAAQSYSAQNREAISLLPSRSYPAGTDELGRDRASRIALALLLSFGGACCASILSTLLAVTLALVAVVASSWLGKSLLYIGDVFLTLPWLFLLMIVRSVLPLNLRPAVSELVTFLLLALLGTPIFLRLNYEKLRKLLKEEWMVQAHAAGFGSGLLARQLWPHLTALFWTQFVLFIPACVLAEANLGALGLGLSEPLPSFGTFLASLQSETMLSDSKIIFLPALVMIVALVALEITVYEVEP